MLIYATESNLDDNVLGIAESLDSKIINKIPVEPHLQYDSDGLALITDPLNIRSKIHVDFLKGKVGWRIKRSQHESNLKKALGKNKDSITIYDATAGFLADSMIFLSLGHKVIAIEKNKIVFHLVNDAIKRASKELEFINKLDFRCGDSFNLYQSLKDQCDIVYLDPMYPVTKKNQKKSGAIEAIKFLQKQENFIDDSEELINKFLNNDFKKIILKRPLKSKKKYSNINYQVKVSTTRFDIYL